jgi:SPP1 family predicted phage head-tail adaptor
VRAGRLRHRVAVQRATDGTDAYGDATPTWTTLATVWASVEPLTGREYFSAAHLQAEVTTRIVLRPIDGVTLTPKDRVLYGARSFDILQVSDVGERGRELQIMAREIIV